jgi:RNA polymerase sigma-70 factor (ECF subfamily)
VLKRQPKEKDMQEKGLTLYRRFLCGDEGGLEELITLYQHGLLRFIYGYVHDIALAEDIFTDVFMTLYCNKHAFRAQDDASLKTYLYTIARNQSLNALRKRKRRKETSLESLAENGVELFKTTDSIDLHIEKSEQTTALHDALNSLHPDYTEVLILRYFEELSPEKIAKITHRTPKQVYNLLARGKTALKEKLTTEATQK